MATMTDDYYKELGISKNATADDVKKAFRKIARSCHPDVAGSDESKINRFKRAKKAYEVLSDPKARSRYDRRHERRTEAGTFFEAFYKQTEKGFPGGRSRRPRVRRPTKRGVDPANNLDLEDLFSETSDFGFGGGRVKAGGNRPRTAQRVVPVPGEDIHIQVDVESKVAVHGGTVTAVYYRMQRADSWRPGASEPGLVRIQDIADIRLLPGTSDGEMLRERGLGDAGAHGGPYGDLIVRLNVKKQKPRSEPQTSSSKTQSEEVMGDASVMLDVSVVEAILGGRIELDTPQGRVMLVIPPNTSSGRKLRLKRRGVANANGEPTDLYVVVRIVVPKDLDEESRRLIQEFAVLNPGSPRD